MQSLPPEKLRRITNPNDFDFKTTADITPSMDIIGQPRGTRALSFGINIRSEGYNIYALGDLGTGRTTAIQHFLKKQTEGSETPNDWIYVHNFIVPHQPRAIELPPGVGARLKERMRRLINDLRRDLPQAFESETYQESIRGVEESLEAQTSGLLQTMQQKAAADGFALLRTPSGFGLTPTSNGRQLTPPEIQQLPPEQQIALEAKAHELTTELDQTLYQIHQLEMAARDQMKTIDRNVAEAAVQHHFEDVLTVCQPYEEMCLYVNEVHEDVLNQIEYFAPQAESENSEEIDLRRYEVNLLVDNSQTQGSPVIVESNPTYNNLFGRLEYEMQQGFLSTHFTYIKPGSLHRANGGYLILNANDLLRNSGAWEGLKRALREKQIAVQPAARMGQGEVLAKSLDPEPIPLNVKIIMLGNLGLYYNLFEQDEDFQILFKVRADFDSTMPRDKENEREYATFVASRCVEENLLSFDQTAVAKVIEYGSRLAEHQKKLSTRFGFVADLIREASYWASHNGHTAVTATDVRQALDERAYRANRAEELTFEYILDGTIFIAIEGAVVGQVNGLSVIDLGDYSFGQPGRITARTFMGDDGITHIERETEMSGPIHEKGVLTLNGYLGGTYAQNQPLTFNASLTFEQTYNGIDGDSASSTELYALLSSLSEIPIKQGIGVTGSVNQRGEIQPIGGVNEKIEGFFHLCKERGLSGEQGVLIPESNIDNLMLHEDVVTAVAEGKFHVWAINHIDEGIELLTGMPAGKRNGDGTYPGDTIHHIVQTRLMQLAEDFNNFGNDDDDDDDD